jgi:hypothetical protein
MTELEDILIQREQEVGQIWGTAFTLEWPGTTWRRNRRPHKIAGSSVRMACALKPGEE